MNFSMHRFSKLYSKERLDYKIIHILVGHVWLVLYFITYVYIYIYIYSERERRVSVKEIR